MRRPCADVQADVQADMMVHEADDEISTRIAR